MPIMYKSIEFSVLRSKPKPERVGQLLSRDRTYLLDNAEYSECIIFKEYNLRR